MGSPAIRIRQLFISPEHNYFGHHGRAAGEAPILEVDEVKCVVGRGLEGDRFMSAEPNHEGQVTFFAEETWERLCEKFEVTDKGAGVFRRNIITRGVDLNALIGHEFEVQGVHFFGTEESAPCYWMEQAFCEGALRALQGQGGLRAKILTAGMLRRDRWDEDEHHCAPP
jgi:MOSC domain-containing protein YiiM